MKEKVKIKSMEKLRQLARENKIMFGIPGATQGDLDESTYITVPMQEGNFSGSIVIFNHDARTDEYLIVDHPNVIHPSTYEACRILFEEESETEEESSQIADEFLIGLIEMIQDVMRTVDLRSLRFNKDSAISIILSGRTLSHLQDWIQKLADSCIHNINKDSEQVDRSRPCCRAKWDLLAARVGDQCDV